MPSVKDADALKGRPVRSWAPPLILVLMGLAAVLIGLNNLFVPTAVQAPSVAALAGDAYLEQLASFDRNPLLIRSHAAIGTLFVGLAAFQFWRGFRNRHRTAHRMMGYAAMACLVILPVSGVAASIVYPFAGVAGVVPNLVWMVIILGLVAKAWQAVRQKDILGHEAWVTRATGMTLGIVLSRAYQPLLVRGFHVEPHLALAIVFWLGQGEGLAVAELWVRRPGGPLARKVVRKTAAA